MEHITVERSGSVTLGNAARPEVLNAICPPMHDELEAAFDASAADDIPHLRHGVKATTRAKDRLPLPRSARPDAHGLKPRAHVVAYANQGVDPTLMLNAPVPASQKVLAKAGLLKDENDVWEVNEAFVVVAEKFIRDLDLDRTKVNPNGGAMALGHPIGATGSILIGTALDELERTSGRYGLVTMCAAGGMAPAIIIERLSA